jgi:hypothetical protein
MSTSNGASSVAGSPTANNNAGAAAGPVMPAGPVAAAGFDADQFTPRTLDGDGAATPTPDDGAAKPDPTSDDGAAKPDPKPDDGAAKPDPKPDPKPDDGAAKPKPSDDEKRFSQKEVNNFMETRAAKQKRAYETQMADVRGELGAAQKELQFYRAVMEQAERDPALAEHPLVRYLKTGQRPSAEEIGNLDAWLAFEQRLAGIRQGSDADRIQTAIQARESARKTMDAIAAEAEEFMRDERNAGFLTEERQTEVYEFLAAHFKQCNDTGKKPDFTTLQQALRHLYGDEHEKLVEERVRATVADEYRRQPAVLPSGRAASSRPRHDMTQESMGDIVRSVVAGEIT